MTIFLTSIIALALLSAWYDSGRINNDLPILHVPRWLVRSAIAVIAAWVTGEWILLLGSWGLFNVVFRPCLNLWRVPKRSVWYISPSSRYDWTFIISTIPGLCRVNDWIVDADEDWMKHGQFYYKHERGVHRAGKLAYIVELAAFGLAVYLRSL
jgi:hypothetical protein